MKLIITISRVCMVKLNDSNVEKLFKLIDFKDISSLL